MPQATFDRRIALQRLGSETFDVLVVGGGITGCGVALDAAVRGLKVGLVEGRDFASGTSSKSSKMVHGGLRYLQQKDFLLVYEALHERQRLLRNAPHLVHPLPFLIPLFGRGGTVAEGVAKAYSTALWLYDVTGGLRIGHRHRRITSTEALAHLPTLQADRLVASFLYWDAQADDARLTLAIARSAAERGAVLANYAPVAELVERDGRVSAARLGDGTTVRAHTVVNAGGVWGEVVRRLGGPSESAISIRPAKGIHVTVPSERLPCDCAAVLTVPGDRRSIFVVPWAADEAEMPARQGGYTYIGTTDTDYHGPLDDPRCTPEDVAYVLSAVNAATGAGLGPDDVTGTWAGLRPLIGDAVHHRTADLSRRHKVIVSPDRVVTVTGGKLTTYRKMAADTVDAVLTVPSPTDRHSPGPPRPPAGPPESAGPPGSAGPPESAGARRLAALGRSATLLRRGAPRSRTARLVLHGGDGGGRPPAGTDELARSLGIDDAIYRHLRGRHGSQTAVVLGLCSQRPDLATLLAPPLPYLRAEIVYAARYEMAHTLLDLLARRTRALILDRRRALAAAGDAAALAAGELGWDDAEQQRQIEALRAEVEAEVAAEQDAGAHR